MVDEFKAEMINGELIVKPIIIKTTNAKGGTDVTVKVPSLPMIKTAIEEYGKRNI